MIVKEIHFIHLILILSLQFLLLSCKPSLKLIHLFPLGHESSPELIHLLLQLGIFLFGLFELGLYNSTLFPQFVRLCANRFLLPLN